METNLLSAADLLAGSKVVQDVTIPAGILQPEAGNGETREEQCAAGACACGR